MNEIPRVRIEIESMKHTLQAALMEHSDLLAKELQIAVEQYVTEGNLRNVLHEQARNSINAAVKEEVQNFFRYTGAGRKAIKEAVHEYLELHFPEDKS